ncbi:MAG: DEAD/DEAH box helicase [Alphaproteobacteria bacterium]|nr:DEAD/DEAH box helicase [Alphaproteobacteria bacterium]
MSFKELGLSPEILKAVEECGYSEPTPIQAQAIPVILMGRDVVGLAQTGTGKTAGFTLPMIEILAGGRAKARMPRSLILTPTRELAAQIAENFDMYGKHHKLTKALLVGGVSMEEQVKKLDRGVDVLIATPGRMLDLFERGKILMTDIKILVIDEADRMLDMGFIPDIKKIVSLLSPLRQTLLFSATMSPEIRKLTERFLSNPKEITVARQGTASAGVEQFLVEASPRAKQGVLGQIIEAEDVQNAFIFCNRKRDIDGLTRFLQGKGYAARPLHGDMPQSARSETLERFKAGEATLLVCSDVAARGLDVQGLSHVFNYDVPFNAEDYVHRVGRTGRAGMKGRAWTLATPAEQKYVEAIERLTGKAIERKTGAFSGMKAGASSSSQKEEKPSNIVKYNKKSDNKDTGEKTSKRTKQADRDSRDGPALKGFGDEMPEFFRK